MQFSKLKFLFIFLPFFLASCARDNMAISPSTFDSKPKILIAQMSGFEEAHLYKAGTQGWLDSIINNVVNSSLTERLKHISVQPILDEKYYQSFEKALQNKTTWVKRLGKTIEKDAVSHLKHEETTSPYDFTFLKNQHEADFLLVIDPIEFGVVRAYYGFIPTSAPVGVAKFSLYLVRLQDNALFGIYNAASSAPVFGSWDTPPEYSALIQSIENALVNGIGESLHFFFQQQ